MTVRGQREAGRDRARPLTPASCPLPSLPHLPPAPALAMVTVRCPHLAGTARALGLTTRAMGGIGGRCLLFSVPRFSGSVKWGQCLVGL